MTCTECRRPTPSTRRGVCTTCYERHRKAGTRDQLPASRGLDGAYVISEWRWLTSFGVSRDQVAAQLGISRTALDKAIDRHHRKERAA